MKIGQSLKKLRESNKLTQAQFAALVGATDAAVSHWEHDTHYPEFNKLIALADHFNMTVIELLTYGVESKDQISKEELELIKKYREASLNIRESIKLILK